MTKHSNGDCKGMADVAKRQVVMVSVLLLFFVVGAGGSAFLLVVPLVVLVIVNKRLMTGVCFRRWCRCRLLVICSCYCWWCCW